MLDPGKAWDAVIARGESGLSALLLRYVPALILVSALQALGLTYWGKYQEVIGAVKTFPLAEAVSYALLDFVLGTILVLVCAWLVKSATLATNTPRGFDAALLTMAYGLLPAVFVKLLEVIPWMSPWPVWGVGVYFIWRTLYRGVPRALRPEHTHALGLYFVASLISTTGLAAVYLARYLASEGKLSYWSEIVGWVSRMLQL